MVTRTNKYQNDKSWLWGNEDFIAGFCADCRATGRTKQ